MGTVELYAVVDWIPAAMLVQFVLLLVHPSVFFVLVAIAQYIPDVYLLIWFFGSS